MRSFGAPKRIQAFGEEHTVSEWSQITGIKAASINARLAEGVDPEDAVSRDHVTQARELWPGANDLPWEADGVAQGLLEQYGPFTLEEVGVFLGVSRERIRQIEEIALRKLKGALEDEGFTREECLGWLVELQEARAGRDSDANVL